MGMYQQDDEMDASMQEDIAKAIHRQAVATEELVEQIGELTKAVRESE